MKTSMLSITCSVKRNLHLLIPNIFLRNLVVRSKMVSSEDAKSSKVSFSVRCRGPKTRSAPQENTHPETLRQNDGSRWSKEKNFALKFLKPKLFANFRRHCFDTAQLSNIDSEKGSKCETRRNVVFRQFLALLTARPRSEKIISPGLPINSLLAFFGV